MHIELSIFHSYFDSQPVISTPFPVSVLLEGWGGLTPFGAEWGGGIVLSYWGGGLFVPNGTINLKLVSKIAKNH